MILISSKLWSRKRAIHRLNVALVLLSTGEDDLTVTFAITYG